MKLIETWVTRYMVSKNKIVPWFYFNDYDYGIGATNNKFSIATNDELLEPDEGWVKVKDVLKDIIQGNE